MQDDLDEMLSPRLQHYLFAHRALPTVTFAQPARMLDALASPESQVVLLNLWDQAGLNCEPGDLVAPHGLGCQIQQFDPLRVLATVYLPPPVTDTEAYFVGLLFETTQPAWSGPPVPKSVRCFTLERGFNFLDGLLRTVLGEWTADGTHRNLGSAFEPTIADFMRSIRNSVPAHAA